MKKILLLMMCCPMILSAQNGVTVSNLNVASGTVTFNVSWNNNMPPDFLWSDSVWVFVDYNKNGVMTRLPVTSATATAGTVTKVQGNDKGVWVIGNARSAGSFSATVRLLTDITDVAGACAYASNYPPVGEYTEANKIKFTGTPPYNLVLGNAGSDTHTYSINDNYYNLYEGETLQSFTDKTGAPGTVMDVLYAMPPFAASAATWSIGGRTWSDLINANAANINCTLASSFPTPAQTPFYYVSGGISYYNWYCVAVAADVMCPSPWHFPKDSDYTALMCAVTPSVLNNTWTHTGYFDNTATMSYRDLIYMWSATPPTSGNPYHLDTGNVLVINHYPAQYLLTARCVK